MGYFLRNINGECSTWNNGPLRDPQVERRFSSTSFALRGTNTSISLIQQRVEVRASPPFTGTLQVSGSEKGCFQEPRQPVPANVPRGILSIAESSGVCWSRAWRTLPKIEVPCERVAIKCSTWNNGNTKRNPQQAQCST